MFDAIPFADGYFLEDPLDLGCHGGDFDGFEDGRIDENGVGVGLPLRLLGREPQSGHPEQGDRGVA